MPLNVTGTPSNFDCTGTGTVADPYQVSSYNHGPSSSAEIIFTATEDGDIFVNLTVDSELTFDTASLYLGTQLLWAANGQDTFVEDFAVTSGQQLKLIYTKNSTISVGADNVAGTIHFVPPPLPPTKLAIQTQPAGATTGLLLLTQPVIEVQNANSEIVTTATNTITATVQVVTGTCTLSGTLVLDAVSGVASYTDIIATGSGSFRIVFSSPGLTSVTSNIVYFSLPGTHLVIDTQPSALTTTTLAIPQQPVIKVLDANDQVVQRPSYDITTTLTIVTGSSTLSGTTTITTNAGTANFFDLIGTGTGSFKLDFASTGLTGVTSTLVTFKPAATKLVITTQPGTPVTAGDYLSPQPVVELWDDNDELVLALGATVTAEIVVVTGSPVLTGTLELDSNLGVVAYGDFQASGTGSFRIKFTAPDLTEAISDIVVIEQPTEPPTPTTPITTPVRPKRSYVPGKVPQPSDLMDNELAINIPDKKGWMKNPNGQVELVFDSSGGGGGTFTLPNTAGEIPIATGVSTYKWQTAWGGLY